MLDDLWSGILELMAQFVIPDWGAVVALLPILVIVLVVAVLVRVFLGLFRAPPARRGKSRVTPVTPPGIHMPGPSFAPILASIGAFMLFLGMVFGGLMLVVGVIALVSTLLYWLVEAVRVYEHDTGHQGETLPAVVHEGPPPGVHMPGPSYRPFLGAVGASMLMLGLVFGEWLLAVGVIALVVTLLGWLVDARKEYDRTEEADQTGHLENIPAPRTPSLLLVSLGVLLAGAIAIQGGWVPPRDASGGEGAPQPSGPGGPGPTGEPGVTPAPGPEADIVLVAVNIAFDQTQISGPADEPFTIALVNQDANVPHNVELKDASGGVAFMGDIFNGVETRIYEVPALPAGSYTFLCTVHPSMTGTATLD
ncbi:MAG: cytochrome c oxidase subunit 4 [Chloroflexota bacterium]